MDERKQSSQTEDEWPELKRGFSITLLAGSIQNVSGETAWHELLKQGFKKLAPGGAGLFTMRQRGLYTGDMNVEPVAVITR